MILSIRSSCSAVHSGCPPEYSLIRYGRLWKKEQQKQGLSWRRPAGPGIRAAFGMVRETPGPASSPHCDIYNFILDCVQTLLYKDKTT
ncbi:hypothetical protein KL86DPRO_11019 [uncultured delta proteobacterium]|uniref:Uncharacterized protein n=1 Tax=uncultured delta proteobacterium TaxID=34034 RepID=A0A212JA27_9DELT|nr:hypothetical protein KL86DPRO_11019 [uncultured delta proteobacterium]